VGTAPGVGFDGVPRLRGARDQPHHWSTWAGVPDQYLGRSSGRAVRPVDLPRAAQAFRQQIPETIIEPGRGMVGNAGVIESEIVLISRKSDEDEVRWVYLDIGKFGGLAETMDESIRYAIRTPHDGAEMTPVRARGPTCDSADVMYEKMPYPLPVTLEIGRFSRRRPPATQISRLFRQSQSRSRRSS